MKFTATVIVFLIINFITVQFAGKAIADVSPSRETSIGRLIIPVFKGHTENKGLENFWSNHKKDIQQTFVRLFNSKASFEAVPSKFEYGFDSPLQFILSESKSYAGDGILIGEFQGQAFEFRIRSLLSGRLLGKVKVPITSHDTVSSAVAASVDAVMAAFGYDGYIVAVHQNEAKINAGKNQGVKLNGIFDIFDFNGDHPDFASAIHKLGELKITQITDNASLGNITSKSAAIHSFAKVIYRVEKTGNQEQDQGPQSQAPPTTHPTAAAAEDKKATAYKVSRRFWAAVGPGYFSITTQVPSSASVSAQLRSLQTSLSPALDLKLGVGPFSLAALYSSLSNASNTVNVLQGTLLYQILSSSHDSGNLFTDAGIYYSNYAVTPSTNPTTLLITSSTIAPTIEETYQWNVGKRSFIHGSLGVFFPVMTSDAVNGSSGTGSFGFGLDGGWRTWFSQHLGMDLDLRTHYFSIQMAGVGISEIEYAFSSHLFILF